VDVDADPIGIARTVIRSVTNDVGDVKGETTGAVVIETVLIVMIFAAVSTCSFVTLI